MIVSAALLGVLIWANANELDRADRERTTAEGRFKLVIDSAPYAILLADRSGAIRLTNAKAEQYFGHTRTEMFRRNVDDLVPHRFRKLHGGYREGFLDDPGVRPMGAGRDLFGLRKDGTEFPVEIGLAPVQMEDGTLVLATVFDITIRKRAEKELAKVLKDLQRSNTELEQFAYVASHDLQEPLRAISGIIAILQRKYHGQLDGRADEYIDLVVEATGRMQSLINDLLEFSRVERRGKPFESIDLAEPVKLAMKNLAGTIAENDAAVIFNGLPTLSADAGQMTRLFQNLIANAIKFRREANPKIEILAEKSGGSWSISVRDNGIGIDPKHFDRIFIIFQRLHTSTEYPGTGIGLALCKKIVERHGGWIWVESELGTGTTFTFTITEGLKEP
jgi:PAS domain S-box-containing protein